MTRYLIGFIVNLAIASHVSGFDVLPIEELPKHVHVADNEVSLFADYQSDSMGYADVYLLNTTEKEITLLTYGNHQIVHLHFNDTHESWRRAQWVHRPASGCATGYRSSVTLPPGNFLKVWGYKAKAGELKEVRYVLSVDYYWKLGEGEIEGKEKYKYVKKSFIASNIGEGLVSDSEVTAAQYDWEAMGELSYRELIAIATGATYAPVIPIRHPMYSPPRIEAIEMLRSKKDFFGSEKEINDLLLRLRADDDDWVSGYSTTASISLKP
ncbi:MAG: hypothetical protein AB3N64_05000 [Puniceicoccaceae bacterium]